jgi:DNA-binding SARP family transcriptional activator
VPLPFAPDRPIQLQLLGGVELGGVAEPDALLSQTKRMALLAYLALAQPRGFQRRDVITALFWPEHDTAHARGALRKAVHGLRASLGEDAIIGRGDEELALNSDRLWCDAWAMRDALEADHLARALELYRGELLAGFFADAPGFEHWLAQERERLRELAAGAAWTLAERYEKDTDLTLATRWARRAAKLVPADERAIRKVIQLLHRAGDRAGAVKVYEDFARMLRAEYEVDPSAETRDLMERVRNGD